MVGTSKILTVSYGTFSCTLEGFDDSFSTMKAIAEYFRDLAADDRYFGAEPPTPDAEMLARIAEREIARRVEARRDGNDFVLKASQALTKQAEVEDADEASAAEAAASETDASVKASAKQPAETAKAPAEPPVSPANDAQADEAGVSGQVEDELTPEPEAPELNDGEAEEMSVDFANADDFGADEVDDEDFASVDDDAAEAYEDEGWSDEDDDSWNDAEDLTLADVAADEVAEEETEAAEEAEAEAEAEAEMPAPRRVIPHRVALPEVEADDAAEAPALPPVATAPPAHPDADSVAAKLQRIRAVVGQKADTDDEVENEHANGDAATGAVLRRIAMSNTQDDETDDTDVPAASTEAPAEAPSAEAPRPAPVRARVVKMRLADYRETLENSEPAPAPTEAEADPLSALAELDDSPDEADLSDLEALDGPDMSDFDADDEDVAVDAVAEMPSDDGYGLSDEEEAELMAELAELERGDFDEDDDAGHDDEVEPHAAAPSAAATDAIAATVAAFDEDDAFEEAAHPAHETAEFDDEDDDGDLEDDEELNLFGGDFDDEDDDVEPEAAWADDAEDDEFEAAEPVALTDEDDDEFDDDVAPAAVQTADDGARARHPAFATDPDADEEAMSRILARTDDQLSHPDANKRRESLTQVKAAVAAKEASLQLGETNSQDDESANDFRKDLRQAVRPRRPAREGERADARTERPRPAPLKLVAAQRVDLDNDDKESLVHRPAMPVRPRRIRMGDEPAQPARDGSFEAFAREMGAHSLGELLEAAAAYTSYVEGSEDFSRPQLMNKIRGVSDEEFSREEGLRSFGTLLREGRIMKVRNGRFQVSEETRFHPERRAG